MKSGKEWKRAGKSGNESGKESRKEWEREQEGEREREWERACKSGKQQERDSTSITMHHAQVCQNVR